MVFLQDIDSDSDCDVPLPNVDLTGVNFDKLDEDSSVEEQLALRWEEQLAFGDFTMKDDDVDYDELESLRLLGKLLAEGCYAEVLRSDIAKEIFSSVDVIDSDTVPFSIRRCITAKVDTTIQCVELSFIGIAALNIFLQSNYTGPALEIEDENRLSDINPHDCFRVALEATNNDYSSPKTAEEKVDISLASSRRHSKYQNNVLAELAVDGDLPCQVCDFPYFLLIARSIFSILSNPRRPDWTRPHDTVQIDIHENFIRSTAMLRGVHLWNARAIVAHERLLQAREPSISLWNEAEIAFGKCMGIFCSERVDTDEKAATVMLEWGLAEHHFDRPKKGKKSFQMAQAYSGLSVEVTGAEGKRTKYQQKATAQMLVRATSKATDENTVEEKSENSTNLVGSQLVEHPEDSILFEKVRFEDKNVNEVCALRILDQSILLAFCLDVKNSNPSDGLTAEEMGAFLARVLDHHDDWMVYSTALLERAWLEFERSHARERSILQMQAMADQHTNRLTITQSTHKSIEESAPVQHRLLNLHTIVYPPRWIMLQGLADRYSGLGIVTSAAELYTEIEFWDDVVDCYKRAGKVSKGEQIVRERLSVEETPRMWNALGDLTNNADYYKRSIELSKGRFANAYVSLGHYYFEKGDLANAIDNYQNAVKVRHLLTHIWFRIGTVSMQLRHWDKALRAFSEVVQQEPEEADAWANIAAIHMRNKKPTEAYPALVESLKHSRNNWRVWQSKLYTCLDLGKYDEAIQACHSIMDLKEEHGASDEIPDQEEKCIRAIVGGTLKSSRDAKDDTARDSARRTLLRVNTLLDRIQSTSRSPWIFEVLAIFHSNIGMDEKALDSFMKEYRALQTVQAWEKDNRQVKKVSQVVSQIALIHMNENTRESLTKARFLVNGVIQKIDTARPDDSNVPSEVNRLRSLLVEIKSKIEMLTNN